jgi:hypothetical protein
LISKRLAKHLIDQVDIVKLLGFHDETGEGADVLAAVNGTPDDVLTRSPSAGYRLQQMQNPKAYVQ